MYSMCYFLFLFLLLFASYSFTNHRHHYHLTAQPVSQDSLESTKKYCDWTAN